MAATLDLKQISPTHHGLARATSFDIVFVHGLIGDIDKTWQHDETTSWPQWVADDHPDANVWCVGYPAELGSALGASRQLASDDLAIILAAALRDRGISTRPCVLVCHSLGGLLAKRILLAHTNQADPHGFQEQNVAGLMFLGTPHRGSAVASVLDKVGPIKNLTVGAILRLVGAPVDDVGSHVLNTSALIKELGQGSIPLQHLNEDFGRYFSSQRGLARPLHMRILRETRGYPIAAGPLIVDADSADPNLKRSVDGNKLPVEAVPDCNHVSLSKPSHHEHQVVRALNGLVRSVKYGCGIFELGNPRCNEAAHLIFHSLRYRPIALNQARLAELLPGELPLIRARRVAEQLAVLRGDDVHEAINRISLALEDLTAVTGAESADVHAIESVVGALVLLLVDPKAVVPALPPASGESVGCSAFQVPSERALGELGFASPAEYLHIVVEACHATLKQRPVRLGRDAEGRLRSEGTRIMSARVASDPNNWNDEAQVAHLAECIADEAFGPVARQGQKPLARLAGSPIANERQRRNLNRRLRSLQAQQISLVVHEPQPLSKLRTPTFLALATQRFDGLVSFAFGDESAGVEELLDLVAELHGTLYGVVLSAHNARERLGRHA